jgi:hypothetical protein
LDIKDLKNYGVDVVSTMAALPYEVRKRTEEVSRRVILNCLSLLQSLRLPGLIAQEEKKLRAVDLTPIKGRGLDGDALSQILSQVAAFAALVRVVGEEKARSILEEILGEMSYDIWAAQAPPAEDFRKCADDPAEAFRAYFQATMEANRRAGVLEYDVIEEGPEAVQYDVKSCVFYDLAKLLGYPEAARHICLADDLYFPEECRKIGLRFVRNGTLARGDRCCDFRFESAGDSTANTEG